MAEPFPNAACFAWCTIQLQSKSTAEPLQLQFLLWSLGPERWQSAKMYFKNTCSSWCPKAEKTETARVASCMPTFCFFVPDINKSTGEITLKDRNGAGLANLPLRWEPGIELASTCKMYWNMSSQQNWKEQNSDCKQELWSLPASEKLETFTEGPSLLRFRVHQKQETQQETQSETRPKTQSVF